HDPRGEDASRLRPRARDPGRGRDGLPPARGGGRSTQSGALRAGAGPRPHPAPQPSLLVRAGRLADPQRVPDRLGRPPDLPGVTRDRAARDVKGSSPGFRARSAAGRPARRRPRGSLPELALPGVEVAHELLEVLAVLVADAVVLDLHGDRAVVAGDRA